MLFSDDMESIFTHKDLVKTPTAEVQHPWRLVWTSSLLRRNRYCRRPCTDWLRGCVGVWVVCVDVGGS